jgi:hypothetical protein
MPQEGPAQAGGRMHPHPLRCPGGNHGSSHGPGTRTRKGKARARNDSTRHVSHRRLASSTVRGQAVVDPGLGCRPGGGAGNRYLFPASPRTGRLARGKTRPAGERGVAHPGLPGHGRCRGSRGTRHFVANHRAPRPESRGRSRPTDDLRLAARPFQIASRGAHDHAGSLRRTTHGPRPARSLAAHLAADSGPVPVATGGGPRPRLLHGRHSGLRPSLLRRTHLAAALDDPDRRPHALAARSPTELRACRARPGRRARRWD